jgi:prepilin-type N-terminal cleavage/methylation domain-containing protein
MVRHKIKSKIKQAGFTLVELLVTITIFVMLTGVVIFNQEKFNSTIFLTNLSYDIALTLRQAQTYGVNIRGFNTGLTGADSIFMPYGVHFDLTADKSFILFADIDASDTDGDELIDSDGVFDGNNSNDPMTLDRCVLEEGCEKRSLIQKGNKISYLCAGTGANSCSSANSLSVVFVRPNPEAIITANEDEGVLNNYAEVRVTNAASSSSRTVVVQKNGVVYVKR